MADIFVAFFELVLVLEVVESGVVEAGLVTDFVLYIVNGNNDI